MLIFYFIEHRLFRLNVNRGRKGGRCRKRGQARREERAASARHDAVPGGRGHDAVSGQPRPARPARAVRLGPLPERALHARLQPGARARRLTEVRRAQVCHPPGASNFEFFLLVLQVVL